VAHYPDLKFSPVVGLVCAYEEEDNIGAVLHAMPADACGLPVSTLVIVDGGHDHTPKTSARATPSGWATRWPASSARNSW
jgi:hypothetical protein